MEITRITAKDFCCFEDLDLPVDNNGLVWVSGINNDSDAASSNGSGKSTIFKALVWGLYGNTIDGERGDNVVRAGAKRASVNITLASEHGDWVVKRTRKKGSGTLELVLPSGEVFEASNKDLQRKIIDLLGLDFLAFRNTVLYGQNDINRFTSNKTTDSDRKEMLHCILRSNIFAVCRDTVKQDKQDRESDIEVGEREKEKLEALVQEHDLEGLRDKQGDWEEETKNVLKQKESAVEACSLEESNLRKALVSVGESEDFDGLIAAKQEEKTSLHNQIDKAYRDAELDLAALNVKKGTLGDRRYKILSEKSTSIEQERATFTAREDERSVKRSKLLSKRVPVLEVASKANAQKDAVRTALAQIDGSMCPVCNTSLKSDGVGEYRDELFAKLEVEDDKLMKAEKMVSKIDNMVEGLSAESDKDRSEHEKTVAEIREGFQSKIEAIDAEIVQVDEEKESHTKGDDKVGVLKEQRLEVVNRITELEQQKRDVERARAETFNEHQVAVHKLASAEEALEYQESKENPYTKMLEEAEKKTKEYSETIKEISAKVKKSRTELSYAEFWYKGFSNQGVPSYMLDSIMPYLTDRANFYLDILSDGDIKVLFSTQKALKSSKDEYRDKIDITWMIEGQETSYPPSGGQAKKIELATDLALMDLVSYREGHNTNILILDEVLDGLDDVGRQRVLHLLEEVTKFRNSVFVISHDSNMSEVFEHYITVEKDDGISRVSQVSLP